MTVDFAASADARRVADGLSDAEWDRLIVQLGRYALQKSRRFYWRTGRSGELPEGERVQSIVSKALVLWLDGSLRYVPFGALQDGKRWMVEKYAIEAYADSGGTHATGPSAAAPTVRGLGVTRSVGGYDALPAVAGELCSIVRGPIEGLDAEPGVCPDPAAAKGALEGAGYADASFTEQRLEDLLDWWLVLRAALESSGTTAIS